MIIRRADLVDYQRCYPKRLKKIFQSHMNMRTYEQFIPHVGGGAIVGNIPPELIRMFPKETRGNDIKRFQKILGDMAEYLRTTAYKLKYSGHFEELDPVTLGPSSYMKEWVKGANVRFNSYLNELPNAKMSGNISYEDYGNYGNVFRLSLFDKNGDKIMHDKALKVYNDKRIIYFNEARLHGNYAEANFWTYLKRAVGHKLDKTQFTKHYLSDLNNGYALTEFLDAEIPKTTAKVDFQNLFRIKYIDGHHNPRYFGKMYDAGGFEKMSKFMDDKVVLRYFKKLFFRSEKELPEVLARYEAMAQNPKTPHRDKIQKAIDLFKHKK